MQASGLTVDSQSQHCASSPVEVHT